MHISLLGWIDRVRCIFCSLDPVSNESPKAGLYSPGPVVCDRLNLGHCGLGVQHYSTDEGKTWQTGWLLGPRIDLNLLPTLDSRGSDWTSGGFGERVSRVLLVAFHQNSR
jgi:hypothetical protein